jgi:hypothetical protein
MVTAFLSCGCMVVRDMFNGKVIQVTICNEHYDNEQIKLLRNEIAELYEKMYSLIAQTKESPNA